FFGKPALLHDFLFSVGSHSLKFQLVRKFQGRSLRMRRYRAKSVSCRQVRTLERLDEGDTLAATKLDRLGRNTTDVVAAIDRLAALGVRVHCVALRGVDLTRTHPASYT
ncbi:recombinase family protein, partial [Burkholderia pseudomallei]